MSKSSRRAKTEKKKYEKMTAEELLESLKANHEKLTKLREERESKNGKSNTNKNK